MITAKELMERFNIEEEEAKYIVKEAKGFNVSIQNIEIKHTGSQNYKGEALWEVVFNGNKHICYI